MFEGWSEFFLLLGGASGALIGLLFVVTTLAVNMDTARETLARGEAHYMTPTLFHFVTVLVLSATGTVPHLAGWALALVAAPWAALGLAYCTTVAILIRKYRLPDSGNWADVFGFGIFPALLYLGLLATAWSAWQNHPTTPYALAIALTTFVLAAIRNAWDLVAFIAPRSSGA